MGSTQSVQVVEESEEDEDEEEEEGEENNIGEPILTSGLDKDDLVKKLLEQEPEMLCHASASPLSPQLSSLGTPRLGPSIKVWDPYNVLAPPTPVFSRNFSSNPIEDERTTEVFLICHGECELNLRPDLVGGRCPHAALTPNGKRQARALAVFLNSQSLTFNAVYSSPLDRARSMAVSVCQVLQNTCFMCLSKNDSILSSTSWLVSISQEFGGVLLTLPSPSTLVLLLLLQKS